MPDRITAEHVRSYRLRLISRGFKTNSLNPIMGALRSFYGTTLGNKPVAEEIPYARKEDTLPAVLARDQVLQLLEPEPDLRKRTIFTTIYAAGRRRGPTASSAKPHPSYSVPHNTLFRGSGDPSSCI